MTLASSGGIDDTETAEVTASQLVVERANGRVSLNQLGNSVRALALFNQSASDNKIVSGSPMQIGVEGVATPGITTGGGNVSIQVDGNALTAVSSVVISTSGGILTLEADSIRLDQNSHLVTRLAANAADGEIAFKAANNLAAAGGVGATGTDIVGLEATGGISLEAGGVVSQEDGATVLGGALVITANGVALGDEDNNVASLEVRTDGSLVYADADDVSIAGIRGRTGARAGEVVIDTQTARNDGSILQGGAILAGALSAFADGSVLLGNSTNDVDFFEAEAGDSNPPALPPARRVCCSATPMTCRLGMWLPMVFPAISATSISGLAARLMYWAS